MGFAENRGGYWRGRYKTARGKYDSVKDETGATVRFRTKRLAEQAANDAEAKVRSGGRANVTAGRISFGNFVNAWYGGHDLAASTMQNYRRHLEDHLLPAFESWDLPDITGPAIEAWARRERSLGYAESSIRTWRSTLHLVLADAVEDGWLAANPATRRRNRGKRAGRARNRGPEKTITTALGILLMAERAALLSGRDDEFVQLVLMGFTGMRWGEVVGLETKYVRQGAVRVEWQLYELDNGEFHRCPPKDDSHRTVAVPDWLSTLLSEHVGRAAPKPCACHSLTYVFSGMRPPNTTVARRTGPKLADVAAMAGVSVGTASTFLNHPHKVIESTGERITAAINQLGYVRGVVTGVTAAHHRRNGFAMWVFQPAATGGYPQKAPRPARPVPIVADPWPGVPIRGRNAPGRADACWVPIAPDLTPHGLRHTYKTMMLELGTPAVLMDEQMGHEDGSIQGRYSHVTAEMRQRLLDGLTRLWEAALVTRAGMSPGSPVPTLDRLLKIVSPDSPESMIGHEKGRLPSGKTGLDLLF